MESNIFEIVPERAGGLAAGQRGGPTVELGPRRSGAPLPGGGPRGAAVPYRPSSDASSIKAAFGPREDKKRRSIQEIYVPDFL